MGTLVSMAYLGYLTSEVVEDWSDGLIPRREALRRLTLLGVTASAAASALVTGTAAGAGAVTECRPDRGGAVTTRHAGHRRLDHHVPGTAG